MNNNSNDIPSSSTDNKHLTFYNFPQVSPSNHGIIRQLNYFEQLLLPTYSNGCYGNGCHDIMVHLFCVGKGASIRI